VVTCYIGGVYYIFNKLNIVYNDIIIFICNNKLNIDLDFMERCYFILL